MGSARNSTHPDYPADRSPQVSAYCEIVVFRNCRRRAVCRRMVKRGPAQVRTGQRRRRILAVTMRARCHLRSREAASRWSRSESHQGARSAGGKPHAVSALRCTGQSPELFRSFRAVSAAGGAHKKEPRRVAPPGVVSSTRHASIKERCRGGRGSAGRSCLDPGARRTQSAWRYSRHRSRSPRSMPSAASGRSHRSPHRTTV